MTSAAFSIHEGLVDSSRLSGWIGQRDRIRPLEMSMLLLVGLSAALATAFVHFGVRIPGHSIVRAVFPMALGLAVAPRRLAGSVMGAGSIIGVTVLSLGGFATFGIGALVSLFLSGPLLDIALWNAKRGGRVYLGFALCGLGSNLAAFGTRGGIKLLGLDHAGGRPLMAWLPEAAFTYALCGVLAGLLSAAVWFQWTSRQGSRKEREPAA